MGLISLLKKITGNGKAEAKDTPVKQDLEDTLPEENPWHIDMGKLVECSNETERSSDRLKQYMEVASIEQEGRYMDAARMAEEYGLLSDAVRLYRTMTKSQDRKEAEFAKARIAKLEKLLKAEAGKYSFGTEER